MSGIQKGVKVSFFQILGQLWSKNPSLDVLGYKIDVSYSFFDRLFFLVMLEPLVHFYFILAIYVVVEQE